jgi:UDP-GlcNAc:undecaprenyl-phosphate GlcNAc-1-phosphate transferase
MIFIAITFCLFFGELLYFKIADYFNIIDKPNQRSSHAVNTIRGGGILFLMAGLFYFVYSNFQFPYFFLGLFSISVVSFLDDIFTLPNRYRLPFQFLAIGAILLEIDLLSNPLWLCLGVLIIGVGIINAYNFMDGINGITGGYSTIVILALWYINNFHFKFIDNDFLYFILIGLMVFNYFNFRTKARCFAGDVGSISIAFIIVFLIFKLIIETNNIIYILFLAVYGVDSVMTIIHRLILKENIFKAHRLHLFQVIVHFLKMPHLSMTIIYMLVQTIICVLIILNLKMNATVQLAIGISIIITLSLIYIIIKLKLRIRMIQN